jgi:hypothetical protein
MAARDVTTGGGRSVRQTAHRRMTETKASFKTSEFVAYIVVLIGILIAANVIEADGGDDFFRADRAWLYITILTIGYMLSRGLAKSGSREPYTDDDH